MKKMYCLATLLLLFASINTYARKEGAKESKSGPETAKKDEAKEIKTSPGPKTGTADPKAGPKVAAPKNGPVTGPIASDDSLNAPNSFFYEPKNKRPINIMDIYVGIGAAYASGQAMTNAPFHSANTICGSYGTPLWNKYALVEFCNNADFLYSANKNWYTNAFSLPKGSIKNVGVGFADEVTLGFHLVIAGSRAMSWTAGPLAGVKLVTLPSTTVNNNWYSLSVPMTFCYGFKTNLFIGRNFYAFAQYSNSVVNHVVAHEAQSSPDATPMTQQVPVNFGMVRIGAAWLLKPWW